MHSLSLKCQPAAAFWICSVLSISLNHLYVNEKYVKESKPGKYDLHFVFHFSCLFRSYKLVVSKWRYFWTDAIKSPSVCPQLFLSFPSMCHSIKGPQSHTQFLPYLLLVYWATCPAGCRDCCGGLGHVDQPMWQLVAPCEMQWQSATGTSPC